MAQRNNAQSNNKEGRVTLAIKAIQERQLSSGRRAAAIYNVVPSTVNRRRAGMPSRTDCEPNSKKLTKLEEEVIVRYVLELDSRGFPPRYDGIRQMANKLLAQRGAGQVGIKWPNNFVKRRDELTAKFARQYDYKRAKCEDPVLIQGWFTLVRGIISKYGIVDADMYNFDETGFLMGILHTTKVITGSDRRGSPKLIQQGDREWVSVISAVSAAGLSIPPFIIVQALVHLQSWYEDSPLPDTWRIHPSSNGWTTNELAIRWLEHFDTHTKDISIGAYRLLILDGHDSHRSLEFQELCEQKKIVTICMPPHSSHLLQPLDVACHGPLKTAYSKQIENLARTGINHVTKELFLEGLHAAYLSAITETNIKSGFAASGLVPFNPEAVLDQLDILPSTPSAAAASVWASATPQNHAEFSSQTALIRKRIEQHQDSSPSPIVESLEQLQKGIAMVLHRQALIEDQLAALQQANEAASQRKKRKKRHLQTRGDLSIAEGQAIIAQNELNAQIQAEEKESRKRARAAGQQQRRCGRCREPGHTALTCRKDR